MISLRLPLEMKKGSLLREDNLRQAIDDSLRMLITSQKHSCLADYDFGFVFNNLSFENFNENEGVVYNSNPELIGYAEQTGLYDKKISGSSKNLNTFASELRESIVVYEQRLEQVAVSMTYIREERNIYVVVKGVISETKEAYQYTNIIKIWNY